MYARQNKKEWLIGGGSRRAASGSILWGLAAIFAILGVTAGAINRPLGLDAAAWLAISIALFICSVGWYIGKAVVEYFHLKKLLLTGKRSSIKIVVPDKT